MVAKLTDLNVDRVYLVTEGANSVAHIKLFKSKGATIMNYEEILNSLKPEHRAVIEAEVQKALECSKEDDVNKISELEGQLKSTNDTLVEKEGELEQVSTELAKYKKANDTDSIEEIMKSLDPGMQKIVKSMKEQNDKAMQEIAKYKDIEATNIAKSAAEELKSLPVDQAKLVDTIKKGVSPDVLEILKAAANALSDADIFKSKGTSVSKSSQSTGADAWAQIEAKAEAIAKSKSITKAKAVEEAITENPELYKQYLEGGAN